MANEITVSSKMAYSYPLGGKKGNLLAEITGSQPADMNGTPHYQQGVQDVGSSEETVSKGDIGTIGWVLFENVGESGTISIGGATTAYIADLEPGDSLGPLRWATNAVYVKGDAAGCRLEYLLLED